MEQCERLRLLGRRRPYRDRGRVVGWRSPVAELARAVVAPRVEPAVLPDREHVISAGRYRPDRILGTGASHRYRRAAVVLRAVAQLADLVAAPGEHGAVAVERHAERRARRD